MDDLNDINWSTIFKWFVAAVIVGLLCVAWFGIIGPAWNKVDNTNFNTSPTHLQAVAGKFSDDCRQISETKDRQSQLAIENDIWQMAQGVNLQDVQMSDYTKTCVDKALQDMNK